VEELMRKELIEKDKINAAHEAVEEMARGEMLKLRSKQ
jgi:hypothetical protein